MQCIELKDMLFDYNNEHVNKIIHLFNDVNSFYKKMIVYNPLSTKPMQKYWFHIPRCKIFNSNGVKAMVVMAFTPWSKKFVRTVKILTEKINEALTETYPNIEVQNKLKTSKKFAPMLEVILNDNTKIYGAEKQLYDFSNLKTIDNCTMFIELDYVQIINDCAVISWKILQLKELEEFDMSVSFFDIIERPPTHHMHQPNALHSMHLTHNDTVALPPYVPPPKQSKQPTQSKPAMSMMPSAADLMNALGKLKKVDETPLQTTETIKSTISIPLPPAGIMGVQLKKVITKENDVITMLKKEHEDKINKIYENKDECIKRVIDDFVTIKKIRHYAKKVNKTMKKSIKSRLKFLMNNT
jgi:hypothetical protein